MNTSVLAIWQHSIYFSKCFLASGCCRLKGPSILKKSWPKKNPLFKICRLMKHFRSGNGLNRKYDKKLRQKGKIPGWMHGWMARKSQSIVNGILRPLAFAFSKLIQTWILVSLSIHFEAKWEPWDVYNKPFKLDPKQTIFGIFHYWLI